MVSSYRLLCGPLSKGWKTEQRPFESCSHLFSPSMGKGHHLQVLAPQPFEPGRVAGGVLDGMPTFPVAKKVCFSLPTQLFFYPAERGRNLFRVSETPTRTASEGARGIGPAKKAEQLHQLPELIPRRQGTNVGEEEGSVSLSRPPAPSGGEPGLRGRALSVSCPRRHSPGDDRPSHLSSLARAERGARHQMCDYPVVAHNTGYKSD